MSCIIVDALCFIYSFFSNNSISIPAKFIVAGITYKFLYLVVQQKQRYRTIYVENIDNRNLVYYTFDDNYRVMYNYSYTDYTNNNPNKDNDI